MDLTCSTITNPVTASPSGIATWNECSRRVPVMGQAMHRPVCLLNRSLLTTTGLWEMGQSLDSLEQALHESLCCGGLSSAMKPAMSLRSSRAEGDQISWKSTA